MNYVKKTSIFSWIAAIVILAMLFLGTQRVQFALVRGDSMIPAVEDQTLVLIHKQGIPKRYDLIALQEGEKQLIKRVIGLPGDSYIRGGTHLLIGNTETMEDFSFAITLTETAAAGLPTSGTLQADEYFVMGDAVASSRDSRVFGLVGEEQLLGPVSPLFKVNFWE